jgi:multidrug transporter EmrE-like cation transporter
MKMQLDVRIPIGLLFSVLGGILAVFGAMSDRALYRQSLDVNVNLVWGIVMLAFGVVMLLLGRKRGRESF